MLPTSSIGRWIEELGDSPSHETGLYALACSIDHYCGTISPWGTPLLVFGDDPADIYYIPFGKDALFFRWIAANSLEQLSDFACDVVDEDRWEEKLPFQINDSKMTVIDACNSTVDSSPHINLNLQAGSYTMLSRYAESPDVMTAVHYFKCVW